MLDKGTVSFPWDVSWYSGTFFLGCGGTLFGENGNDASAGIQFGGENGYRAARKMIELANHTNMIFGENGAWPLIEGTADAVFSGSWDYTSLKEALGDKLGVAMLPTYSIDGQEYQMTAMSGSKCVGVNPNSDNLNVSAQFAAFLASEEAQLARYETRGVIPAHINLRENAIIASNPVAVAEMDTIMYASVVQPSIPEMSNYWSAMSTFSNNVFWGDININNYMDAVDLLVEHLNGNGL